MTKKMAAGVRSTLKKNGFTPQKISRILGYDLVSVKELLDGTIAWEEQELVILSELCNVTLRELLSVEEKSIQVHTNK